MDVNHQADLLIWQRRSANSIRTVLRRGGDSSLTSVAHGRRRITGSKRC